MLDFEPAPKQEDQDLAKVTRKCAIAGVAVAGYAVAGWDRCGCYVDAWGQVWISNYSIPHDEC